jgi:hypothetical protein
MFMCTFDRKIVQRAWVRAAEMGKLPNSFSSGSNGATVGFVGEMCIQQFLAGGGISSLIHDSPDYDIVAGPRDTKLEVKTMQVKSPPLSSYSNPVLARSKLQRADMYMFVRVIFDDASDLAKGGRAFFCGALPCAQLTVVGTLRKQGDLANGYPVKQDCWTVTIGECLSWFDTARRILFGAQAGVGPHVQEQGGAPAQEQGGPPGQVGQGGPPGHVGQGAPPGQVEQGPPPGQVEQGPPPGQVGQGPPPGQVGQGPPPGQRHHSGDADAQGILAPAGRGAPGCSQTTARCKCRWGLMCYECLRA